MEIYTYIILFVFKIDYTDLFQISRAPPAPGVVCPGGRGHEIERKLRGTDPEKVAIREGRQRAEGTLSGDFCISNQSKQNYRILNRLT